MDLEIALIINYIDKNMKLHQIYLITIGRWEVVSAHGTQQIDQLNGERHIFGNLFARIISQPKKNVGVGTAAVLELNPFEIIDDVILFKWTESR